MIPGTSSTKRPILAITCGKERIVNVASVPNRSPFRYPGGKTWLVPLIRRWLGALPRKPKKLIEPFAGGGTVSLTTAFENLADMVVMVELDAEIAAVWKTILSSKVRWMANRILSFDLTPESAQALPQSCSNLEEKAFFTLLRNRINHGGILAPGSGTIRYGENGKGIKSRWYPDTLAQRILAIGKIRKRIRFIEGDGLAEIRGNAHNPDFVFFMDPPYTIAGKRAGTRLYAHHELDHEELFRITDTVRGDFLMTYDNCPEVRELAQRHGLETYEVVMRNTHHAEKIELLIGRRLDWMRSKD